MFYSIYIVLIVQCVLLGVHFLLQFHVLYFISFGLIITGLIVYSARPPLPPLQQDDYQRMRIDEHDPQQTQAPPSGHHGYQITAKENNDGDIENADSTVGMATAVHFSRRRHQSRQSSSSCHGDDETFLIINEGREEEQQLQDGVCASEVQS